MAALPQRGGCQCGKLRYEITAPPLMVCCCHCTTCQKQTGGAFVLSAIVRETTFRFTDGAPSKTEWTSDSGNSRYGLFCGDCGSRIVNGQTPSSGVFSLRAGTFDDTSWVRPAGHIWVKSAQSWIAFSEDEILCERQPADYTPFIERFRSFGVFADS
ncbi:MAG: GFA family protein [Pseudomonadota bacterium]